MNALQVERRAQTPDLDAIDSNARTGRRALTAVITAATLLASGSQVSGLSMRDFATLRKSAHVADECLLEARVVTTLAAGSDDLRWTEFGRLIDDGLMLAEAYLREVERDPPDDSIGGRFNRALMGPEMDSPVAPSYVRAQLGRTLKRIKQLEDEPEFGSSLGARTAIDNALSQPGTMPRATSLRQAMEDLGGRFSEMAPSEEIELPRLS